MHRLLSIALAAGLVFAPATTASAQEEEESSLLDSAVETVTEAYEQWNDTEGDSDREQIMDDLDNYEPDDSDFED